MVWICMLAKINAAEIEFWYKSYRTCNNNINVLRLASQNITSPPQKNDMVFKQTQILQPKTQPLIIAINKININKACCCAFTIILYPLSSNFPIPVNSYSPHNLCSFKYHMIFHLLSCNATTSQYYAINNNRTCVDYVLILDYFVINYILL